MLGSRLVKTRLSGRLRIRFSILLRLFLFLFFSRDRLLLALSISLLRHRPLGHRAIYLVVEEVSASLKRRNIFNQSNKPTFGRTNIVTSEQQSC